MSNYKKSSLLFQLCYLIVCVSWLSAITISSSGGWNLSIDSSQVMGGAGGELTPTYYSSSNAVVMEITDTLDISDNWEVHVHKVDGNWLANLKLSLLRTSDGSGSGNISGGDFQYVELTAVDQYFFEGSGDRTAVDIQMKLDGVSVLMAADSYSATVYFTLIDTP